jgi:dipeptidase D
MGGHSGLDIHLGRGNAVQLLARALDAAAAGRAVSLAAFSGGNKHNAIAREAKALVTVAPADRPGFVDAFSRQVEAIKAELAPVEPDLAGEVAEAPAAAQVWTEASQRRTLALLLALPHGVLAMSRDIPGLVETSCNLAAAASEDGALSVLLSTRSSVATAMTALRRKVRAVAELAGAKVEEAEGYPAWKPNVASPLLARFRAVHQRVAGKDAELAAVHAGLECGVIGEKLPGMDMISFGPDIKGAHSPDERVSIPSVERFFRLLKETLADLAAA